VETAILNDNNKLSVVLCWHMHQPHYREGIDGEYRLPWVYLHAIKDYTDMAYHLENHPSMKAVVNFAPVLLEQLNDYSQQIANHLADKNQQTKDPLLNYLSEATPIPKDEQARQKIIEACLRCYAPRLIDPYPEFSKLLDWLDIKPDDTTIISKIPLNYLDEQYFLDLLSWYHLAWLGHSLKLQDSVQSLLSKRDNFTLQDRQQLLSIIHDAISNIIPRYKALCHSGQVELSMTPYGHPIVPLLNDFSNMRCSLPNAPAPEYNNYPGGNERNHWHFDKGFELFEEHFATRPKGIWLSEGGISRDALQLLDKYDIRWTASGEGVWRNSTHLCNFDQEGINTKRDLFAPYQLPDVNTRMFFRDDGLSDLIGFEYSNWNSNDAAMNLVHNLKNIRQFLAERGRLENGVVSIILDGENAWEYYNDNGYHFLDAMYKALSECEEINMTHFAEAAQQLNPMIIDQICAGSWVYGSFSTWIGEKDKNKAWDYLITAKQTYDQVMSSNLLTLEQKQQATQQLAICEGSDWFWWFGDYNPSDSVSDFDILYRQQLTHLYQLLQQTVPAYLDEPLSIGNCNTDQTAANAGTMRRN